MKNGIVVSLCTIWSLIGCQNSQEDFHVKREQGLLEIYPVGSPRNSLIERYGAPIETGVISADGKLNRFAAWCIQQIRSEGRDPVRYDAFTQLRLGAGASLGAAGMYEDYVFYDRDDRVLKACRMQLD